MKRFYMSVASTALALFCLAVRPSAAATQMVSLVYNGSPQSPQQIGSDEFRRKLAEIAQGRIILDERAGNAMGSETALLAAMRSGVVDMATLSGSVVSSAVPEFGVFDVPFLFRDAAPSISPTGGWCCSRSASRAFATSPIRSGRFGRQPTSRG
jgi:TRAP-type C4-dicarboxylate transport system substrate-binding protein